VSLIFLLFLAFPVPFSVIRCLISAHPKETPVTKESWRLYDWLRQLVLVYLIYRHDIAECPILFNQLKSLIKGTDNLQMVGPGV